jgi:hypothetical protein
MWSLFPGTYRRAVDMGIFPDEPASVLDLDIEILLGLLEGIEAEKLAIELLTKSTTASGHATSMATIKAMEVIGHPDSAFEGLLRRGEIALALRPGPVREVVRIMLLCGMDRARLLQVFISEISTLAQAMMEYINTSLIFLSPSGSLSMNAARIALSKFLT